MQLEPVEALPIVSMLCMLCLAHHEVEAQKDQHSPHVFTGGHLGSDPACFSLVSTATAWHEETHVMTDSTDALPRDGDQANTPANAPFLCLSWSSDARQRKDARLRHMALGQDPVSLVNMPNRIGIVFGGMFTYSVFGRSWPMPIWQQKTMYENVENVNNLKIYLDILPVIQLLEWSRWSSLVTFVQSQVQPC